jgi:hypothetical protein
MVEGMLAEPWLLRGHQEARLREFLELLPSSSDGRSRAHVRQASTKAR